MAKDKAPKDDAKEPKEPKDVTIPTDTLGETENFIAWRSQEPDGEVVYHLELGSVTLHFYREEWDELVTLMDEAAQNT